MFFFFIIQVFILLICIQYNNTSVFFNIRAGVHELNTKQFFIGAKKTLKAASDSPLCLSPRPGRCHGMCS